MSTSLAVAGDLSRAVKDLSALLQSLRDAFDLGGLVKHSWVNLVPSLALIFDRLVTITGNPFDHSRPGEGSGFTSLQVIHDYNHLMELVADGALVLTMTWAFLRLQWAHTSRGQYGVRVMLPRFMLAVILIHFSLPLVQAVVDLNNALCKVILLSGWTFEPGGLIDARRDLGGGPGLTLLLSTALVLALLVLALAYFVRYALLVVLAVTAPVASLLFVLPDTQHYAREWMSLFLSTLFMQPLQLLILIIGLRLETATGFSVVRHGFVLGAIIVAFKVPGALHTASSLGTHAQTVTKRHLVHLAKASGIPLP